MILKSRAKLLDIYVRSLAQWFILAKYIAQYVILDYVVSSQGLIVS